MNKRKKKLPYILAVTQPKNSSSIQCLDALSLKMNHDFKNPILFYILNTESNNDNGHFQYLGNSDESEDRNYLINTMLDPVNSSAESLFNVGICYKIGKYLNQNIEEAFKWIQRAAIKGHAEAQYLIGIFYNDGKGVKENPAEAIKWLKLSAKQHHPLALHTLGCCYSEGHGVKEDKSEAVKHWKLALELQEIPATLYHLGVYYALGFAVKQDFEKAMQLWSLAAKQNLREAKCILGCFLFEEINIKQDPKEGERLLREAIEQGDLVAKFLLEDYYFHNAKKVSFNQIMSFLNIAERCLSYAQFQMGLDYYKGNGAEKNISEAIRLWKISAKEYSAANYFLACHYDANEDFAEAVKYFKLSADQGHKKALFTLGMYYMDGVEVEKNVVEGIKYFTIAALQGDADSQHALGDCYYNGLGVEQNILEAIRLWKLSAEQNNKMAAHNLGCYYAKEKYTTEAIYWWRLAAEQGVANSQYNLGFYYYKGIGLKKNIVEARKWIKLSAGQDFEAAKKLLKKM